MESIYSAYKHKNLYIMLNETMDCQKRSILNVLIGSLEDSPGVKPIIIFFGEIENTKSE